MSWSIESVREAPVRPGDVYRFYVDPSTWANWGHNTRWARADGTLTVGSVVRVKAGYGAVYPVRILRLEPDRLIVCEVRPRGLLITSSFEVTPTDAGARLTHTIEVGGRFASLTRVLGFPWLYRRLLAKETRRLVARVSDQGSGHVPAHPA
jgi:uncharacterized protein YndB with AHSA1/START domain